MEENEYPDIVQHIVPGKGSYPFYKYVFTHTARRYQPDALKWVWLECTGEEVSDDLEDYDLIAMIAWYLSCQIYHAWVVPDTRTMFYERIRGILGDSAWVPSGEIVKQGARFL